MKPDPQQAATAPPDQVVARVADLLGDRLTCYIAGVRDARAVARWKAKGNVPYVSGRRLQIALQVALLVSERYRPEEIAPWFTWLCDELGDKAPADVLRCATTEEEFFKTARALVAVAKVYLVE
jgi:hypothetical protein